MTDTMDRPATETTAADDGFDVSLDRLYAALPVRVELHDDDGFAPAIRHLTFKEAAQLRDALGEAICSQHSWGQRQKARLEARGDQARNRVRSE
jgi:hypothetical protein